MFVRGLVGESVVVVIIDSVERIAWLRYQLLLDVVRATVQAVVHVEAVSLLELKVVMLKIILVVQLLDRLLPQLLLCSGSGLVSCGFEV